MREEIISYPAIVVIIGGCYIDGYDDISKFQELMIIRNEEDLKFANDSAYDYAIQSCESWEGQHGFVSLEEIAEDNGLDLDDYEDNQTVYDIFREKCENHADYCVKVATLEFCSGINEAVVEQYQKLKKEIE